MELQRKFLIAIGLLGCLIVFGALGYHLLLGAKWLDAIYMTVITLSSVGFGEIIPGLDHSAAGRIFTMLLILMGVGTLTYVLSASTAFFVEGELTNLIRRRKMERQIAKLDGHFIVCGYGATGVHVVDELRQVGERCVVIEASPPKLETLQRERPDLLSLEGDATDEHVLTRAGLLRARGLVAVLSSDKDNLFITFTARQLNSQLRIISRVIATELKPRMLRAGADGVVCPNQIGGLRMASELIRPHVVGFLDRMLRPGQGSIWRFEEVEIEAGSPVVGATMGSLDLSRTIGIPILALSLPDGMRYYPPAETVLEVGARLVVLGEREQVARLRALVAPRS